MAVNETVHADVPAGREALPWLHERLDVHFTALAAKREAEHPGTPVFALEHGLTEPAILLLKAEVCAAVGRGALSTTHWLPFVVYATEIGYEYAGEEYWPTFEARTPRWAQRGDRNYIRDRFKDFRDNYNGAVPTGAWAGQFRIICWPITHAVLPTDLQRNLARVLFDYRRALTGDLLRDTSELGRRLAARAFHASARFRNFAQNTDLLGQVAAALLTGDDDESPYLLDSTLHRIVSALSEEREARRWLRDAKVSASQLRLRGLGAGDRGGRRTAGLGARERLPEATDPSLLLLRDGDGWAAYADLPDLTVLAERLPSVHDELGALRAKVAGVGGSPLWRGRLLAPGQRVRFERWPSPIEPLITLERGSAEVNALLADQCVMPVGPVWVFRVREDGSATQVRGRTVRPARTYVLVSENPVVTTPDWITTTTLTASGVYAYVIALPDVLDEADLSAIRGLGLAAITDVDVRPAGFVAAVWDGEGAAEWLAGEDPLIAVSATRTVDRCIFTLDGALSSIEWPGDEDRIFVQLTELEVGSHELDVALVSAANGPMAAGSLKFVVRPPEIERSTGSFREGLMILPTPIAPTLPELWDEKAFVEVHGPPGAEVEVSVEFANQDGALAREKASRALPVLNEDWLRLLRGMRDRLGDLYDETESCVIAVRHPVLGEVSLRADREFAPLRWVLGRNDDGPFARLVDSTDGTTTRVRYFPFDAPDRATLVDTAEVCAGRWTAGGLLVADTSETSAAVIVPPVVRDLNDLRRIGRRPRMGRITRSVDGALSALELAEAWCQASLGGDPFAGARRTAVLKAITGQLVGVIGGRYWLELEHAVANEERAPTTRELREALGNNQLHQALAADLSYQQNHFWKLSPPERAPELVEAFRRNLRHMPRGMTDVRFAEFVLRFASDPEGVRAWAGGEFDAFVRRAIENPIALRAARFVVFVCVDDDAPGQTYGGWLWE